MLAGFGVELVRFDPPVAREALRNADPGSGFQLAWARSFAGPGPLITDDRPLPEYFYLRRAFGPPAARIGPNQLRSLTGG